MLLLDIKFYDIGFTHELDKFWRHGEFLGKISSKLKSLRKFLFLSLKTKCTPIRLFFLSSCKAECPKSLCTCVRCAVSTTQWIEQLLAECHYQDSKYFVFLFDFQTFVCMRIFKHVSSWSLGMKYYPFMLKHWMYNNSNSNILPFALIPKLQILNCAMKITLTVSYFCFLLLLTLIAHCRGVQTTTLWSQRSLALYWH